MGHLKPVDVSGHLDDLIGQINFIEFILLVPQLLKQQGSVFLLHYYLQYL